MRGHHHWLSELLHIHHRKGPRVRSAVGEISDPTVEQFMAMKFGKNLRWFGHVYILYAELNMPAE